MDVWTQFFHPFEGCKSLDPYPRDGKTEPGHDKRPIQCRAHLFRSTSTCLLWLPDFSHFKALALNAGDIPVLQLSEWFVSYNRADMVKWSLISESWLFVVYCCNNILYFFPFSPHADCALGPYLCCMWLVGHSRPSYGATRVRLGLLQWKPWPAHYRRMPVLHKDY